MTVDSLEDGEEDDDDDDDNLGESWEMSFSPTSLWDMSMSVSHVMLLFLLLSLSLSLFAGGDDDRVVANTLVPPPRFAYCLTREAPSPRVAPMIRMFTDIVAVPTSLFLSVCLKSECCLEGDGEV